MATAPGSAKPRPSRAARRVGYAVAVLVNIILLGAINGWPGWEAVPFLTDDTAVVIGWVNASIAVGIAVNLIHMAADPPALKALGDLVTAAVGIVPMILLWQVFPFDFPEGFNWTLVVRVLLGLGIFGSVVGMIAALASLVRGAAGPRLPTA